MIKAKRIICILLCILTVLSVAGCGSNNLSKAKWEYKPLDSAFIPRVVAHETAHFLKSKAPGVTAPLNIKKLNVHSLRANLGIKGRRKYG